jgi:hypothetical protein
MELKLNDEQQEALAEIVSEYNAQSGESLSSDEYFAKVIYGIIDGRVVSNFETAVKRLGDAAKQLPYEQRTALVAQVSAMIGGE